MARSLFVMLMLSSTATAAEPVMDTSFLKLYAETRGFMLGRPTKPKITPDGKAVLFLRSEAKSPKNKLFEFDIATGKTCELLSPESLIQGADENLTPEEKARRERQRVSTGGFADFHLEPVFGSHVLVKLANALFILDRTTGKTRELKTGKDGAIVDPKWSPDGKLIGYVRGFDVYAYDLAAEKETAITTGGTQVKTHGLAEFVAQEEMGRHSGFWWSPDSKSIAYEEADHTGVEQWFVADPLKPDQPPSPQYYPRPGKKNVSVRLGVKKLAGTDTVWVDWDRKKHEYLTSVTWQKYGPLTIQAEDRRQQQLLFRRVDVNTGKTDLLEECSDEKFLALLPNSIHYLKGGEQFLFLRVGFKHQILSPFYSHALRTGKLLEPEAEGKEIPAIIRYLTQGFDALDDLAACNTDTGEVLLITKAGEEKSGIAPENTYDPTRTVLKRCNLLADLTAENGKETGLKTFAFCKEPGMYSAVSNSDLTSFIATRTTLEHLPVSLVLDQSEKQLGTLPSLAIEPSFKPKVKVEKVGDYWTAVVRPQNFDPKKKYPVIVDVYGGPKHLHVVQAMRNWLVPQWLADQGFIVVAIDGRGTPGRGAEWEKAIYKKFGTVPLEDQVKGLHALCDKFPEMDRERVGIVGWSFGGYNAANGVLRRPDVFKAAVAGAPVTDWEDYDTHYTERYLGLMPESKAAYDEASLIPLAKDLSRPLLLVHGTADDNVYYRHTLKLSDALFRAGRDFESLALPGITHMVSADPVIMERLWAKTAGFFKKHLGEPK